MQSLLQTKIWADFKSRYGWQSHEIETAGQSQPIIVLQRTLPLGRQFFYAPEVSFDQPGRQTFAELAATVKTLGQPMVFRLELFSPSQPNLTTDLTKAGYRKSFEAVQPEDRQWLDIAADESTLLANMKEKGRYNVRLAERKGVTTRISTDTSDVDIYYSLFQQTAKRDGFQIRTKAYFVDLCQTLFTHNLGELVIAEHEGEPLTALIITYYDGLASYMYGASSNNKRNLMAPYAAHWAVIQSAKRRGCVLYDLLQIAPDSADGPPENHHYTNLTRFKQQFGGRAVTMMGGWDFVYQPVWYASFRLAEGMRRGH